MVIALLSLSNVLGYTSVDSDLFWAIAGIGLVAEACLELYFEAKEDSK